MLGPARVCAQVLRKTAKQQHVVCRARSALSGTASQPREANIGVETGVGDSHTVADFSSLPSPRGLPVVGTTLALIMAGSTPQLHRYVDARHAELGPVYREAIGPVDAVFVADPVEMRRVFQREGRHPRHLLPDAWMLYNELYGCKRGLFFMDGEEWLGFRRVMNQVLLKGDVQEKLMQMPCSIVAEELVSRWATHKNEVRNLEAELYLWSIQVLVATLLGGDSYKRHCTTLSPMLSNLATEVHLVFQESARLALLPARLARALHLPVWGRFERAVDRALHGASSLVLELLPMSRGGDGLLERMLNQGLELRDVVRIVADLILAAGDTTSYSTLWSLYLLARHPDQQELVSKSVREGDSSSSLVRNVIKEALRLYPVAPFITRLLPEDCEISGYNVPAGNLILLSLYTSGRSAANFPEPEKFWPERWSREEGARGVGQCHAVTNPQATLPFALGARSCIGRKLAETQMTEVISRLLRDYRLELVDSQKDVQMILRLVSVPSEPVRLRLVPRK